MINSGIKAKRGVDPVLERAADAILKRGRLEDKKFEKDWRYKQNTKERKNIAENNPTGYMKKTRAERVLKKLASETGSKRTGAAAARAKAKEAGRAAAVSIAKARKLKARKEPITAQAIGLNKSARRNMDEAKQLRRYLAYDEGMYHNAPDGTKIPHIRKASKIQAKRAAAGLKTNPIYDTANRKEFSAKRAAKMSKDNARKSGGLATAMKRNAESGMTKIAMGKTYKAAARIGGALSIASMFASHLMGKKEKKRG